MPSHGFTPVALGSLEKLVVIPLDRLRPELVFVLPICRIIDHCSFSSVFGCFPIISFQGNGKDDVVISRLVPPDWDWNQARAVAFFSQPTVASFGCPGTSVLRNAIDGNCSRWPSLEQQHQQEKGIRNLRPSLFDNC